jgi:uncharacterized membrane protein YtjA (UPF0391 family)
MASNVATGNPIQQDPIDRFRFEDDEFDRRLLRRESAAAKPRAAIHPPPLSGRRKRNRLNGLTLDQRNHEGPHLTRPGYRGANMTILRWALLFFLISVVAGVLGFTGLSAASADIARFLFYVFVVIFLVLLILGLTIFRV